jgi:hypothetical protein
MIDFYGEAMLAAQRAGEGGTIELTNSYSMRSILTPAEEVPAEYECGQLEVVRHIRELPAEPYYATGLVYSSGWLWFSDFESIAHAINPETGDPEAAVDLGSIAFIHAAQADSFWTECHCSFEYLRRISLGGTVEDIVQVEQEFDAEPKSAAFDAANEILIVNAYRRSTNKYSLLRFNANAEPDVLVSEVPSVYMIAMSHRDGRLWVLDSEGRVAEIDLATGQALRSFRTVNRSFSWLGIAVTDESIFLLGKNYNGIPEIIETRLPQ